VKTKVGRRPYPQQKTQGGTWRLALRCLGKEIAMSNAPDPVPPPGKPKIGMIWIVVALAFGLVIAAWIYSAVKPAGAHRAQETKPSVTGPP
jgi:hypothetical protein